MKTQSMIAGVLVLVMLVNGAPSDEATKKDKRGAALLGSPGFDAFEISPNYNSAWTPGSFGASAWPGAFSADLSIGPIQVQTAHDIAQQSLKDPWNGSPGIAYTPEVLRAVQQAKEANHNVIVAQHRVADAKQAAIIQQKVALAREAAARDAVQRFEEISAHAQAEARASAQQLVALQQKLASLKDAVAAAQRLAAKENSIANQHHHHSTVAKLPSSYQPWG